MAKQSVSTGKQAGTKSKKNAPREKTPENVEACPDCHVTMKVEWVKKQGTINKVYLKCPSCGNQYRSDRDADNPTRRHILCPACTSKVSPHARNRRPGDRKYLCHCHWCGLNFSQPDNVFL